MPWLEMAPVEQRERFIDDHRLGLYDMTELCARYAVSRKTGYKWLARYDAGGRPACTTGYEYLTRRGLTFVGSLGIGCALGLGGYTSPLQPMVGLGLGYTWSTKPS